MRNNTAVYHIEYERNYSIQAIGEEDTGGDAESVGSIEL